MKHPEDRDTRVDEDPRQAALQVGETISAEPDGESKELSAYLSQHAMGRARLYHLLAIMLVCPDDVLERFRVEGSLREQCLLAARASGDELLAAHDFLAKDTEDASCGERFHALRVEYTRLFCQFPLLVSPYGADHIEEREGEELAVRRCYRRRGLIMRSDFHERADHIAAEFDFLFYLAHAEALAWGQGDHEEAREWRDLEREFYASHLKEFASSFSRSLEHTTAARYYNFAAQLIRAATGDPFFS